MRELWQRLRLSVLVKLIFVAVLVVLLGIPLLMIDSLVDERQARRTEAVREVNSRWGAAQTVGGPILAVPYLEGTERQMAYVLPDSLTITAAVAPETRYRSIYEVILYQGTITLAGSVPLPALPTPDPAREKILWSEAELLVTVSDIRGIRDTIRLQGATGERQFEPVLQHRLGQALGGSPEMGATADGYEWSRGGHNARATEPAVAVLGAPLGLAAGPAGPLPFQITLNLNGSGQLLFLPLGRETRVAMRSPWPDPSFCGAFLPVSREIRGDGFTAEWQVYHLSRNIPQHWAAGDLATINAGRSAFGVEFLFPVDNYQRATRAIKYGMMFIVLTFLAFFLFEILQELRIHPVQYLLIGFALCLFYLLLLSFSEHIGFNGAYLVAAVGIVGMVSGYCWTVLRTLRRALLMGTITTVLYGYLFVLLQLQDYALLCGSIGLFLILGLVMYLTRRINWYAPGAPPAAGGTGD